MTVSPGFPLPFPHRASGTVDILRFPFYLGKFLENYDTRSPLFIPVDP